MKKYRQELRSIFQTYRPQFRPSYESTRRRQIQVVSFPGGNRSNTRSRLNSPLGQLKWCRDVPPRRRIRRRQWPWFRPSHARTGNAPVRAETQVQVIFSVYLYDEHHRFRIGDVGIMWEVLIGRLRTSKLAHNNPQSLPNSVNFRWRG